MKKDAEIYLTHILQSIEKIETSFAKISAAGFNKDIDLQDATIRRLEVIGEAVKNIPASLKRKYSEVQWRKIAGTRDILIHAYFSVDIGLVYDIVKKDLPNFKIQIITILEELA